jgi:hypothetical protein
VERAKRRTQNNKRRKSKTPSPLPSLIQTQRRSNTPSPNLSIYQKDDSGNDSDVVFIHKKDSPREVHTISSDNDDSDDVNYTASPNEVILYPNTRLIYRRPNHPYSVMQYGESKIFSYNKKRYTRYHINMDGHCLFDTLSYLFLYYKQKDNWMRKNSSWLEELGWRPKEKTLKGTTTCRNNLLNVFQEIYEQAINETLSSQNDIKFCMKYMKEGVYAKYMIGEDVDYAPIELINVLFPLMFNTKKYKVCVFLRPVNDYNIKLVQMPFMDDTNPDGSHSYKHCTEDRNKKQVYVWYTGNHFEPVLETPGITN